MRLKTYDNQHLDELTVVDEDSGVVVAEVRIHAPTTKCLAVRDKLKALLNEEGSQTIKEAHNETW